MFGYVIPDRASLSPEAQSRYRSAYSGCAAASMLCMGCGDGSA